MSPSTSLSPDPAVDVTKEEKGCPREKQPNQVYEEESFTTKAVWSRPGASDELPWSSHTAHQRHHDALQESCRLCTIS